QGNRIESAWRFIYLYYFYLQDAALGRLFIRLCPYFPFNIQVYVNGHEWLARQLIAAGISFRKDENAFLACAAPERLQALADSFQASHLVASVEATASPRSGRPPTTTASRSGVGSQRGVIWPFSNRPSPNRTCNFRSIRLSS